MKKIKAFGKLVSREEAYRIIIRDKIGEIVYARNSNVLECILFSGWKSLEEWTDKELEEYINDWLCEENQDESIELELL